MAMTVRYNASANRALNQTNKNDKARSKALGKVASGMKINSAQDDAASFSISARMRVKLRALEQDTQNVQNGSAILNTAEGGIQRQIDIIRTIREKVIDAANDHNTDEDRQTIQKELVHLYDEMESIAYGTDFNSKKPLIADKIIRYSELGSEEVNATKLNLIRDAQYETLDNVRGPFATFEEYSAAATSENMSGGVDGTPKIMTMDFSNFSSVNDLNGMGFYVRGIRADGSSLTYNYVLANDTSLTYNASVKVPTGNSISDTVDNLVSNINSVSGGVRAERDGLTVKLTTENKSLTANSAYVTPYNYAGGTRSVSTTKTGTGAGISGTTSGGVTNLSGDKDLPDAAPATLTVDLSVVDSNKGFRFDGYNFRVLDSGATGEGTVNVTLTKGQSLGNTYSTNNFNYTFDGTNLTFTARTNGANFNNYAIDGNRYYYSVNENVDYETITGFSGAITNEDATSDQRAFWDFELSGKTVDDFRNDYNGKLIQYYTSTNTNIPPVTYKFYDSDLAPKIEGLKEDDGSRNGAINQIDIKEIRRRVENDGLTLAAALKEKLSDGNVQIDGDNLKITSLYAGTLGNQNSNINKVTVTNETVRHYDIDFSNIKTKIPDGLYGKGFRAYCATDNREWFNFVFTDGTDSYDSDKDNIKSINIDVSAVTNANELVQTIYTQGNAILTGDDPKLNHHMRLAADLDNNIITLYDHCRFNVSNPPYTYQERGAKIADGVSFTEEETLPKDIYVRDLIIQHTDKADMNIHIQIPQMTLDQIFDPLPINPSTIFDYPVTDKESRNFLLGNPNPPGILDNGLKYLLDAVTLVGAQNKRLEFTAENITTEMENVTASESTIRDADMAKEMTEYTKYNILAQSSQAMLAQANQNQSMVLSLLQ